MIKTIQKTIQKPIHKLPRALSLAATLTLISLAAPNTATAGMSYPETVPQLAVGQTYTIDATAKYAEIDELQLVFMFTTVVGNTFRVDTMPYNMTKAEDDTVFRRIENGAVIDDDGGQNNHSSAIWTRTVASTNTATIENYGFNIRGFNTPLKNLRVVITRLK